MPGAPGRKLSLARWEGHAYVALGKALYVGPAWDTRSHAHHALQICVGLERPFRIRWGDALPWESFEGVLIASDVPHQLDGDGARVVVLYLEPESVDGRKLAVSTQVCGKHALDRGILQVIRRSVAALATAPPSPTCASFLFDAVLSGIGLDVVRSEDLDTRVAHAVKILRERPVTRRSLGELAKAVGLSQSRLRHLFSEELGMSFRGYVLWLRIYDALSALGSGATLTDAALSAGFSDAAHFSRTFRRVFGLAPSQLSGAVSLMTARAGPQ